LSERRFFYEAGLKEKLEAVRLVPYNALYCRTLGYSYLLLNRIQEVEAIAKQASTKCGDVNPGVPGEEDLVLAMQADTAAYFGHVGKALEFSRRAADSAVLGAGKETAAGYYAVSATREALFGGTTEARRWATLAKRGATGRDLDYGVALALAYAGDANRAKALADDLGKKFPEDTTLQFNYLRHFGQNLRSLIKSRSGRLIFSGLLFRTNLVCRPLGFTTGPIYTLFMCAEKPTWQHRGSDAATEFQKILDHSGLVFNEPIGALAHLQLGRAYALQGNIAKSRSAYRDFLALWKDADPDIPIYKQAKVEYAKLQ